MTEPVHTLVVDDEDSIRFSLAMILEREGHVVETAASGEQALTKLQESVFSLVVLDLRLGGRVDGLRVLEAVKWRWPDTAVIILTAYGSLESAMAAIEEGFNEIKTALDDWITLCRGYNTYRRSFVTNWFASRFGWEFPKKIAYYEGGIKEPEQLKLTTEELDPRAGTTEE